VASDVSGDADTDDANELIAYAYDAARAQLVRAPATRRRSRSCRMSPPAVSSSDTSRQTRRTPPAASLDATQSAAIRRVDVRVRVERPNPDVGAPRPLRS